MTAEAAAGAGDVGGAAGTGDIGGAAGGAGVRLGGDRWWDDDRARHLQDRPRFCPHCATAMADDERSLSVEYWEADRRVYRARCGACGWTGDIVRVHRVEGHEPD